MQESNLERLHSLLKQHEELLEVKRTHPKEFQRQNEEFHEAFVRLARSTILPVLKEIKDVLVGKVESASIFHRRTAAGLRIKLDRWEDFERSLVFFGDDFTRTVKVSHEGIGFGLQASRVPLSQLDAALVEEEAMKFLWRLVGQEQLRRPVPTHEARSSDRQADRKPEADRRARLRAAVESNPALSAEISNLELLDDSALLNAAQTRMPQPDSERMEDLHRKQRLSELSEAEAQELARLEQQYERVILVRSHSALLLEQRGHDIQRLTSSNESRRPAPGEIRI